MYIYIYIYIKQVKQPLKKTIGRKFGHNFHILVWLFLPFLCVYIYIYIYIYFFFQTSPVPDFREFYKGAQVFAESDPSVLSTDPDVHRDKVAGGKYAFFAVHGTLADMWRVKDCDIVAFPETFMISSFGFYLRKGSPYTPLISEA